MNRIRKLLLVDEQTLATCSIRPQQQQQQQQPMSFEGGVFDGSGYGGGPLPPPIQSQTTMPQSSYPRSVPTTVTAQYGNPFTPFSNPLERKVMLLDAKMLAILQKKIPTKQKLIEYLETIKEFMFYRDKLDAEDSAPMQVPMDTTKSTTSSAPQPVKQSLYDKPVNAMTSADMLRSSAPVGLVERQVTSNRPDVTVDAGSVETFGKQQKLFSQSNMVRSLSPKMRPKFNAILDDLKSRPTFDWDRYTGEIAVNGVPHPGSNVKDLVMHKLRLTMNENTYDPPHAFGDFDRYVKRHSIAINRPLRSRGPAISAIALKRSAQLKPRDRRAQLQQQQPQQQQQQQVQQGEGYYLNF